MIVSQFGDDAIDLVGSTTTVSDSGSGQTTITYDDNGVVESKSLIPAASGASPSVAKAATPGTSWLDTLGSIFKVVGAVAAPPPPQQRPMIIPKPAVPDWIWIAAPVGLGAAVVLVAALSKKK